MGIYTRKKSQYWWMSYRVGDKQHRHSTGTTKKKLAQKIYDTVRADIARGKWDITKKKDRLFDELCESYMVYSKTNKRSWKRDRSSVKNLLGHFSGMKLTQITFFGIEAYKTQRLKKAAPASVNRELACLKYMFNLSIREGRLGKNPMRGVKLLREDNQVECILTADEREKLILAAKRELKPILITALNTGMRLGEILNLKWTDIDLRNKWLFVRSENSKSKKARQIPMNNELREVLSSLPCADQFVFMADLGRNAAYWRTERAYCSARKLADLEHVRFHDLRHTFASNLVANGVDIVTVKDLLGHSTITMTMRYAHTQIDSKRAAVETLGAEKFHTFITPAAEKAAVEATELPISG